MTSMEDFKKVLEKSVQKRWPVLSRKRLSAALLLTAPALLFTACGGETAEGPIVKDIVSIEIVDADLPGNLYAAGEGTRLYCTTDYTDGTTSDVTNEVAWESNDTAVATVNRGLVQGLANEGSVAITATFKHFTAPDQKVLSIIPLKEINITSDDLTITDNLAEVNTTGSFGLNADGTFADDHVQSITESVLWTSSNTTVATVASTTGLLTVLAEGSADINATLYDINATPLHIDVNLTAP